MEKAVGEVEEISPVYNYWDTLHYQKMEGKKKYTSIQLSDIHILTGKDKIKFLHEISWLHWRFLRVPVYNNNMWLCSIICTEEKTKNKKRVKLNGLLSILYSSVTT